MSRAWWYMPLIPALGRQRQADFWVRGQPGLQSEFQDSQGYTEKPSLEKQNKTKQNKTNKQKNQNQNQKQSHKETKGLKLEPQIWYFCHVGKDRAYVVQIPLCLDYLLSDVILYDRLAVSVSNGISITLQQSVMTCNFLDYNSASQNKNPDFLAPENYYWIHCLFRNNPDIADIRHHS